LGDPEGELSILFTDDREMKKLNMLHRRKNATTDVLSFPAGFGPGPATLGDVVISLPTAKTQARKAGWPPEREAVFLLIHGILHLLGYDHERGRKEAAEMADVQRRLLTAAYA
jgi:probable rRNA maturation factor